MDIMIPREVELVPEWTGLPGGEVYLLKRFERSNGVDTELYKNIHALNEQSLTYRH